MKTINNKRYKILQTVVNAVIILIVIATSCFLFLPETTITISKKDGEEAIYSGDKNFCRVSLMFNVYENVEIVNGILDLLKEYKVKATFFVGGCFADDNAELLQRMVKEGHEIANHGYFHKDHKNISEEENRREIYNTEVVVKALTGVKTNLFAPPSGSFSLTTLKVAKALGYKVIMWSKDTIDWRDNNEELVFKRATERLENGDLILMHPKEHTLNALGKIISYYLFKGFEVVTVTENIGGV